MSTRQWVVQVPSSRVDHSFGPEVPCDLRRVCCTACMMALGACSSTEQSVVCSVGLEVVKISFSMRLGAVSGNRVSRE